MEMRKASIGGMLTSAQGLGCMGMSEYYGPSDWDQSVSTIRKAVDLGVTLLDTADIATPTRVRFCWGDAPVCNLYDQSGLPAGPFEIAIHP